MNPKTGALLAGLTAACLGASVSQAMQMALTRPELCAISETVVIAEVTGIDTLWSSSEVGGLERHAFLDVEQVLAGSPIKGGVVVLAGGQMGDFRHWVEDVPELEPGVRYALFLGKTANGYEVLGGEAGAVQIADATSWAGETTEHIVKTLEGCRGN